MHNFSDGFRSIDFDTTAEKQIPRASAAEVRGMTNKRGAGCAEAPRYPSISSRGKGAFDYGGRAASAQDDKTTAGPSTAPPKRRLRSG
jgi:hypothetical protein